MRLRMRTPHTQGTQDTHVFIKTILVIWIWLRSIRTRFVPFRLSSFSYVETINHHTYRTPDHRDASIPNAFPCNLNTNQLLWELWPSRNSQRNNNHGHDKRMRKNDDRNVLRGTRRRMEEERKSQEWPRRRRRRFNNNEFEIQRRNVGINIFFVQIMLSTISTGDAKDNAKWKIIITHAVSIAGRIHRRRPHTIV